MGQRNCGQQPWGSTALQMYCTKQEASEVVFSYGETTNKVCVGLARRREANPRGMARVNSQKAVHVQTSSEALVDHIFHTSRLTG